ncbi:MAG: hypothetical protein ACTTJ2_06070 [Anaerovoracaceae bacterium]
MERKPQKCKQCDREIYFDGICATCRAENEKNEILALTEEEIAVKIGQICDEIENTGDLDKESHIFRKLLDYRDINTEKIAETAFKHDVFYPCELYKDASDEIVKSMIEMVKKDDLEAGMAGHLLLCLAAAGGDEVFKTFLELEQNPRKWRKNLYVNPSFYASYGGWSYDKDRNFVKTNFDKCYPMVKGTLEDKKNSPVKIGVKTDEKCIKCGCTVVNLMEIDCRDERLDFLGIDGIIKAKCCPNCFEFSDGDFCRYIINGESEVIFSEDNVRNEDYLLESGVEELSSNTYVLGNKPVPLRYAADWDGGSSVGGFAFWIQDCEIKMCPDCGKPMKYLAQIQWDTVLDSMEGNAYIEICKDCKIMVMLHQQT